MAPVETQEMSALPSPLQVVAESQGNHQDPVVRWRPVCLLSRLPVLLLFSPNQCRGYRPSANAPTSQMVNY